MALTLSDFIGIANGKYRRGSVLVTDDGKLRKINNHVILPNLRSEYNQKDNVRTRVAFYNAIVESGLYSDGQLMQIRRTLGLIEGLEKVSRLPLRRRDITWIIGENEVIRAQLKELKDGFDSNVERSKIDFLTRRDLETAIEVSDQAIGAGKQRALRWLTSDIIAQRYWLASRNESRLIKASCRAEQLCIGSEQMVEGEQRFDGFVRSLKEAMAGKNTTDDDDIVKLVRNLVSKVSSEVSEEVGCLARATRPKNDILNCLGRILSERLDESERLKLAKLYRKNSEFDRHFGFGGMETEEHYERALFDGLMEGCGIQRGAIGRCYDKFVDEYTNRILARIEKYKNEDKADFAKIISDKYGKTKEKIRENLDMKYAEADKLFALLELDIENPSLFMEMLERSINGGVVDMRHQHKDLYLTVNNQSITRESKRLDTSKDYSLVRGKKGAKGEAEEALKAFDEKLFTTVDKKLRPAVGCLCSSFGLLAAAGHEEDFGRREFTQDILFKDGTGATIDGVKIDVKPGGVHVKAWVTSALCTNGSHKLYGDNNQEIEVMGDHEPLVSGSYEIEAVVPHEWSIDDPWRHPIRVVEIKGIQPSGVLIEASRSEQTKVLELPKVKTNDHRPRRLRCRVGGKMI